MTPAIAPKPITSTMPDFYQNYRRGRKIVVKDSAWGCERPHRTGGTSNDWPAGVTHGIRPPAGSRASHQHAREGESSNLSVHARYLGEDRTSIHRILQGFDDGN